MAIDAPARMQDDPQWGCSMNDPVYDKTPDNGGQCTPVSVPGGSATSHPAGSVDSANGNAVNGSVH